MTGRLKDEIKQQKPFPRRSSEAFLGILRTAAVLEHHLTETLKPYGVTTTQYNVLRILRGAGAQGLCGREVAARLVSRVPDVSRLLDRMAETGLLSRERDPADRRHVTARITAKGLEVLRQATPDLDAVEESRFDGLDGKRLQGLIDTLDQVRGNS